MFSPTLLTFSQCLLLTASLAAAHPLQAPGVTSLTNPAVKYETPDWHHVVLKRGPITAVIVDNEAIEVPECPGHRAGYSGVAVLRHAARPENLFVPGVAGLNFEHIHDGSRNIVERFEPRRAPMRLRIVDRYTVELHQPPTPNFQLESCGRYVLLEDGAIEYTFECIPRAEKFANGYIGLFWASYIQAPESIDIHFVGRPADKSAPADWLRASSPSHGVDSTHPPEKLSFEPKFDAEFSLTLANHRSRYVYAEPWYYGVSHGLAYVQMFRARDQIWFAQSPSGGNNNRSVNPAWDFQWFVPEYKVGEAYGFVMRAALLPFESQRQVRDAIRPLREALEK
jgi:hypothetical protein